MSTEQVFDPTSSTPRQLEHLFSEMVRIRVFEDITHRLFMQNEIDGSIHLYQGQEAISVGVSSVLQAGDTVSATYRGHGACLARGTDPEHLFAELLGRESGVCGGRAGSMNVIDLEHGILGCFAIVGGSIAAATGAALAAQLLDTHSVSVAFFGDGAVNQAYFHECLNFAAVRSLAAVYVCENNQYGEFTPMAAVTAGGSIVARAAAYAMPGHVVDGNDILAVAQAASDAVEHARSRRGPVLLECLTYRHKGHSRHDDPRRYRPAGEFESWLERDPITQFRQRIDAARATLLAERAEREIAAALERARQAPLPELLASSGATKEKAWPS